MSLIILIIVLVVVYLIYKNYTSTTTNDPIASVIQPNKSELQPMIPFEQQVSVDPNGLRTVEVFSDSKFSGKAIQLGQGDYADSGAWKKYGISSIRKVSNISMLGKFTIKIFSQPNFQGESVILPDNSYFTLDPRNTTVFSDPQTGGRIYNEMSKTGATSSFNDRIQSMKIRFQMYNK